MARRPFVHLHCHSHYSLLDGASKIPDLVQRCRDLDMPALAVTDHGNLYGAWEFLREGEAGGIQPILGLEAYVAPGHRRDRKGSNDAFHLTLLAQNAEGIRNLMRLSSKSFLEGFYFKPRIDHEILEQHSEGLICLSGCASSEFSDHILRNRIEEAKSLCAWYTQVFQERFFVEIQDNGVQIQHDCAKGAIDIANRMGLPLVGTSDAHYLTREDARAHDVLLCINTKKNIDDPNRMKFETEEFHVRSPEEMYEAMPGHDEALKRSAEIAATVDYSGLDRSVRHFPSFATPKELTDREYLDQLCREGLTKRYGNPHAEEAVKRLESELSVINRMGFASYFLIVWDFVRFAREQGIACTARGSACGALVAYLLELSHVDPIHYDLLFERFLDPNRSEAPDIDIDLDQDRRYEVIEYVRNKYGSENVAQIGTFGTMAARAVIKDVARTMNIPLARVNQVVNLVPQKPGVTLADAFQTEPELNKIVAPDPELTELMDFARRLEGMARNVSTHAAGVVVANRPLIDLVPLQRIPSKERDKDRQGGSEPIITQWNMGDVESAGLLKMDFLGLRNLTILDAAVRLINARHPERPVDLQSLPLDDAETFALLQRGETKGVFQLESTGIRELLIKMKPDVFRDIIATNALYRPGPLKGGMVDAYIDRKHGREQPTYEHPAMKEVLEETHGVMVYQEQVMRILNRLGGVELSKAYKTIKAISKKKTEQVASSRVEFIAGAVERGLSKNQAEKIFELIVFFGGYGFNKSHSTAYALVAYQTAYLKAHFPTEFMAALLSSEIDGAERSKLAEHLEDCRQMDITVRPPDINQGKAGFEVIQEREIAFGLVAINGVGFEAVRSIVSARETHGPYLSLTEIFERASTGGAVTQSCVESLIKAGALDGLGPSRKFLLTSLPKAYQDGHKAQQDRKRGQGNLFADLEPDELAHDPRKQVAVESFSAIEAQENDLEILAEEKKVLGFYMSSHPLTRFEQLLANFSTKQVKDLGNHPEKTELIVGGMIASLKLRNVTKSRSQYTRMASFTFEDLTGSVEAILWPEEFARNEAYVQEDRNDYLQGSIDKRRERAELIVNKVTPMEEAASSMAKAVILKLRPEAQTDRHLDAILSTIREYGGRLELYFELLDLPGYSRVRYRASGEFKVQAASNLILTLRSMLGPDSVDLVGPSGGRVSSELLNLKANNPIHSPLQAASAHGAYEDRR